MHYDTIIFGGLNRLIMRKLVCDCCGEEIDTTYMRDFDIHPAGHLVVYGNKLSKIMSDRDELEYDLCDFCVQKVVDCIKFNQDVAKNQ